MTTQRSSVQALMVLTEYDNTHCYDCGGHSTHQASIADLELLIQQMYKLADEYDNDPKTITAVFKGGSGGSPDLHYTELKVNVLYEQQNARYKKDLAEYNRKLKVYSEKLPAYEKQLAEYNAWKAKDDLVRAQKRLQQAQKQVDNLQKRA